MPSNFTEHYQLSQWKATDQVLRADFNADNAKIDAVLAGKGNCRIVYGTYTGTGEYGLNHPNTLTFPFPPKIVFITSKSCSSPDLMMMAIQGQRYCHNFNSISGAYCECSWNGNTFKWYNSQTASWQFNTSNNVYFYVALG